MKSIKIISFPQNVQTFGNLALNYSIDSYKKNNEQPKVKKIIIGKRKTKIFAGCWQEANGQDFC